MANVILYMGKTTVGKSYSLRNLPPKETNIIRPNTKSLIIPGWRKNYIKGKNLITTNKLSKIKKILSNISKDRPHVKYVVLEDFTHFFNARVFSDDFMDMTEGNEAFQRWNEFGAAVFQALFDDVETLREDLTIVVIHHTEVKEDGDISFKSAGKLLDNTIEFDSYFSYVFHGITKATEEGQEYKILTNRRGSLVAKTPPGCFPELVIDNDLMPILETIRKFEYGE